MVSRKCFLLLGIAATLFVAVGSAYADSIPIVDPSFENYVITNPPWTYGQIYESQYFNLFEPWMLWQGALTNPAMLEAALPGSGYGIAMPPELGVQCMYLWTGDPSASNRPVLYQNLDANFEAGKDYTLTVAAAMARGAAAPGQTLEISLGYWEEDPGTAQFGAAAAGPTLVAQRLIAYNELTDAFNDFSVSTGAISADDLAVGQPLVVFISQGNAPYVFSDQQYYVDNVRCSSVPEPSAFALLASGLLGLLICGWKKMRN
jgi:hypothetical protein